MKEDKEFWRVYHLSDPTFVRALLRRLLGSSRGGVRARAGRWPARGSQAESSPSRHRF